MTLNQNDVKHLRRRLEAALQDANRAVGSAIQTALAMRYGDEGARQVWLERALDAATKAAQLRLALVETYEPCKKCNRKVPSPCHDELGMRESGPWDFSCEAIFRGEQC